MWYVHIGVATGGSGAATATIVILARAWGGAAVVAVVARRFVFVQKQVSWVS